MAPDTSIANIINQSVNNFLEGKHSPIIDLRCLQEFNFGHLIGASHFPVETIISRMFELPKRSQPLRLLGKIGQIILAKQLLVEKGYQIEATLEWDAQSNKFLFDSNALVSGTFSPRLWSPAPLIKYFHKDVLKNDDRGKALDIGCGAGRDSVYLATKGWEVDAIDYLPDALAKVKQLARHNEVKVSCHHIDLEVSPSVLYSLNTQFQLILVSRYLHRPLLPVINDLILPGGYIVYQTFMEGCEKFGSPKNQKFLLKQGELAKCFDQFDILVDEIEFLEDGRPTNVFIAQKNT